MGGSAKAGSPLANLMATWLMTRDSNLPSLIVEGGLHRTAVAQVPVGGISVGSDAGSAIVVSDLPAASAFRLTWDRRAILLEAVECDAAVNGRRLARGRSRVIKRASTFTSGGIAFRLEWPQAPVATSAPAWRRQSFAAGVACTIALTATAALVAAPSWPPGPRLAGPPQVAAVSLPAASELAPPVKPVHSGVALLGDFRRQLASAGLDGISVDLQPDGGFAASGRILPVKGEAWRAAVRWFDGAAKGRAALLDRVEVTNAATALQIQAVYTGLTPYVIDGEGQKLFLGASLPDGSVIQTIESRRVVVKRGDQLVAVRF